MINKIKKILYLVVAIVLSIFGMKHKAINFVKKAEKFCKNDKELKKVYMLIAYLYGKIDDYDNTEAYVLRVLNLNRKINDHHGIVLSLYNLSSIYYHKGNYKMAAHYLSEALQFSIDEKGKSEIYNSLGHIYTAMEEYSEAVEFFKKALTAKEQFGETRGTDVLMLNIGDILMVEKNFEESIYYLNEAIKRSRENRNKYAEANAFYKLGLLYYYGKDDKTNAEKYLKEAYKLFKQLRAKEEVEEIQELLEQNLHRLTS